VASQSASGDAGPVRSRDPSARLVFVHGAGGYLEDRPLADAIARSLDAEVVMPHLPDEDMSVPAWAAVVRAELARAGPDDLVAGHSFGATILLQTLRESRWPRWRVALLAMPDWGPDGWGVAEYVLDGPEPECAVSLHHCRDDAVVPFSHLALNASRLPAAEVVAHGSGGHQFEGREAEVAAWLANR